MICANGQVEICVGDCRDLLRAMPDQSVNCIVTSPPYFGLRDYGTDGQIGLESSPDAFVAEMVAVFREARRVLRDDGTCWVNLGDTYNAGTSSKRKAPKTRVDVGGWMDAEIDGGARINFLGLKPKDLCGMPWRVAFALQADGWYLRQDIIWAKPNPMPESVRDRCTKAHEYVFLLTKSARYWYDADAVKEPVALASVERLTQPTIAEQVGSARVPGKTNGNMKAVGDLTGRNKRSVWTVATQPYSEAHFATYPPALIEPCILAGCPKTVCAKCGAPHVRLTETDLVPGPKAAKTFVVDDRDRNADRNDQGSNRQKDGHKPGYRNRVTTLGFAPTCACDAGTAAGVVLDPFGGAGTTGLVAARHHRKAILCELNPDYARMAHERISREWREPVAAEPEPLGGLFA